MCLTYIFDVVFSGHRNRGGKEVNDIFEQAEIDARAEAERYDRLNTPERQAALREKAEAERRRHIELGWYDEDGNPGPNAEPNDEDED
jgi:hypothetical protein